MGYSMTIKTIFLDRDGVINIDKNYLYKIIDFEFIDGIFEVCLHFQKLGYKLIIITNQSGIDRGLYSKNDYHKLTNWMILQFKKKNIEILDVFHCPHIDKSNCKCRKPKPGMLLEAKNKYNINMAQSWMIGDNERDILAAKLAGVSNSILVTSQQPKSLTSDAHVIVNSILDLKEIIN
jgi:D-glycero-D-manno-heptose 1,7-bisphosphate phosphatase